ncbi:hypothetical protein K502DRAFT_291851 [Neoconidiobolus thromboides FSU 785]|nr:hypothetical protein K502DRAFT_291851 [Neoconidiobolus thromboides FSU 785]
MDPTNARQLWLGNLQQEVTTEDLCNVIRGGLVVNIKLMIEKHCAFVTFADPKAAIDFFNHANSSNVVVKNRRIKVGWGKPTPLSERLQDALQKGATRNIYLGGIDAEVSEDKLRQDFSEFGEIEQIHIIRNKNTGFVNFTTLLNAVSAYERIQRNEAYSGCTIRYGKDRCNNAIRTNSRNGFNNYNMTSDQNGMGYNNSPIHTPYGNTTPLNMTNPHLSNGTF